MKNIVITGASGLVATELTHLLLESSGKYNVYAVSTHPEKLVERYQGNADVNCLSIRDLDSLSNIPIDAVVHCAFARSKGAGEIAKSIRFTTELLGITRQIRPKVFVNVSSQSVYGQTTPPLWTEQTPPAPDYLYALGKFATEELTHAALRDTDIKYTSIRLSSVCENARFLNEFAKNALSGIPITVQGGNQMCSFIDVRDVARGLKAVIDLTPQMASLSPIYNLGTGTTRTIRELAEDTKRLVEATKGISVEVNIVPADIKLEVGMDNSLFCSTFSWRPEYGYDEMVASLIALNDMQMGGKMPYAFTIVYSERKQK